MSWLTLIVVVLLVMAVMGMGVGYSTRPADGPAPAYFAPMGGLAALLLVALLVLLLMGVFNGFEGWSFRFPANP